MLKSQFGNCFLMRNRMFWDKKEKTKETNITPSYQHEFNVITSLQRVFAFIEFTPTGEVINANELFLSTLGYELSEVVDQHHRMFCLPQEVSSKEYREFWDKLARGESNSDRFERIKKDGSSVWIEASYTPVIDEQGQVTSIVKLATDITELQKAEIKKAGLLEAIERSMAGISFDVNGHILEVTEAFLNVVGYQEQDIVGKHHQIFCPKSISSTPEYKQFWKDLKEGKIQRGLYERIDSRGNTLWLEGAYNPIFNSDGSVDRVVKFVSDVTQQTQKIRDTIESVQSTATETEQVSGEATKTLQQSVVTMDDITNDIDVVFTDIKELNNESEKINAIVSTISSIAEQTNLLALNAAIEAARAGEQGRGFAVVADEVRTLAARTSNSTSEIANVVKSNTELTIRLGENIEAAQEKSQKGVQLISHVDGIFKEINQGMSGIVEVVKRL